MLYFGYAIMKLNVKKKDGIPVFPLGVQGV